MKKRMDLKATHGQLFCNGRLRLSVSTWGFSLWDTEERRWVLDASFYSPVKESDYKGKWDWDKEPTFEVSKEVKKLSKSKFANVRYEAVYPKKKKATK